ncbi:stalk domain-containing protein [Abyssisolibacter fermentans]|uniref:stalk domain-containing protein n=1 Tax=Abyssisolibacter fermentans TaxID=1766203 RepID=UPI000837818B|nr:stalk domain-containing protein [Abyssisolibacter fermentans]
MNKKLILVTLCVMIISFSVGVNADEIITSVTATINDAISLTLDDEKAELQAPILIYNGTSYLPVRSIANLTGLDVEWDNTTKTIKLIKDPVNLEKPGIMDLHKKGLVSLNRYGDAEICYNANKTAKITNDKADLVNKDGVKFKAGLVIDDNSTGHDEVLKFSNEEAEFNSTTIKLNSNYKKMSCYVKVQSIGKFSSLNECLTSKLWLYDADTNTVIGSHDFTQNKVKKNEESNFIKFDCDVTGIDKLAIIASDDANYEETRFIIADIQFEK